MQVRSYGLWFFLVLLSLISIVAGTEGNIGKVLTVMLCPNNLKLISPSQPVDSNGNLLPDSNGNCPTNYTNVNGVCIATGGPGQA